MWWWKTLYVTFNIIEYLIEVTNPVTIWDGVREGFLAPLRYYFVAFVITVIVMMLMGY